MTDYFEMRANLEKSSREAVGEDDTGDDQIPPDSADKSMNLFPGLPGGIRAQMVRLLGNVPKKFSALFEKCFLVHVPPRLAIKAKCQQCVCYEDVVQSIKGCTCACPLWQHRPYQKNNTKGDAND